MRPFAHLDRDCFGKPSCTPPAGQPRLQPRTKTCQNPSSTPFPPIFGNQIGRDGSCCIFSCCLLCIAGRDILCRRNPRRIAAFAKIVVDNQLGNCPVSERYASRRDRGGIVLPSIKFTHLCPESKRAAIRILGERDAMRNLERYKSARVRTGLCPN